MICGKNQVVLIDMDSKRSSSSCFQGHNLHHQVTCFKLYIFFPSMIFKNFSNLKGIICTKNRGPFLVQELTRIVPLCMVHLFKYNTVLSELLT